MNFVCVSRFLSLATRTSLTVLLVLTASGCKTKSELRREQEFERIKADVRDARGTRADLETVADDLKTEITRLSSALEEQGVTLRAQHEEMKKELASSSMRLQALEQRAAAEDAAAKKDLEERTERSRPTLENAKRLYDGGDFDDAIEVLRGILRGKPKSDDAKRAQFLLADSYFAAKDFASAALEYGEFRKNFPKDSNVPNATYRMATSFRSLGKTKEAKLFYQELIERFPKHNMSTKARADIKKMRNERP